jgi:hypothetical protein
MLRSVQDVSTVLTAPIITRCPGNEGGGQFLRDYMAQHPKIHLHTRRARQRVNLKFHTKVLLLRESYIPHDQKTMHRKCP